MIRRSQQNSPVYGQRPIQIISPQHYLQPEHRQTSPQTLSSFRSINRNRMNTLVSPYTRENSVERVSDQYQSPLNELKSLRTTVTEKNFILKQLQDHNEHLNKQLHRTEEQWMDEFKRRFLVDYNNFQILEYSLKEKLQQANAKIAELSQPKTATFMELKSIITSSNDQFNAQLQTQTNQLSKQQTLTAKIEKQLDEDLTKLQSYNNEIQSYKNEISKLKEEISQLKEQNKRTEQSLQTLQDINQHQNEETKNIVKQKDSEINLLRLSKQTQLGQIDTLMVQLNEKNNQLKQLQKTQDIKPDNNLQAEFDKLKALYGTSQQNYCILQNSYDLSQSELKYNLDKLQKLQKDSDGQISQIQQLNSKIESTENQNHTLNKQLTELQKELKDNVMDQQRQKHLNDSQLEQFQKENQKNKLLIESLNTQIHDLQADLQNQINEQRMVNVINTIRQNSSIREEIIKKKDSEIQQLTEEIQQLKQKLTSENEQLQNRISRLQNHILKELQFNDLVEQLQSLEKESKRENGRVQLESGYQNGITSEHKQQDLTEFNSACIDGIDHRQGQIQFDQISQQLEELEFVSALQAKFKNYNQDIEFESGCPQVDHRQAQMQFEEISQQLEELEFVSALQIKFIKYTQDIEFESGCPDFNNAIDHRQAQIEFDQISQQLQELEFVSALQVKFNKQEIEFESGCPEIDHRLEALKFNEVQQKLLDLEFEGSLTVHI